MLLFHFRGNSFFHRGKKQTEFPQTKHSNGEYRQEITRYPSSAILAIPTASSSGAHYDHLGPTISLLLPV